MSRKSTNSRSVSKSGYIYNKVVEYIKPSRPDCVHSQRKGFGSTHGDDGSSVRTSVNVPGEEIGSRGLVDPSKDPSRLIGIERTAKPLEEIIRQMMEARKGVGG
jgi:hypothetical protein